MASIQLMKESWNILKKDKELMLYPLVSGIIVLMLFVSVFIPVFFTTAAGTVANNYLIASFMIFYVLAAIVSVFFTASLIGAANMRFNGKDPKFSDGIKIASKHLPKLIIWALINATVGLLLRALSEGNNIIAKIISYIISLAWSLLTLFTIPVILFEKKGSIASIKRSGEIFVKTWGESVIGQFSIGALFGLGLLAGIGLLILTLMTGMFILFAVMFVLVAFGLIILYLITSALNGIYITALYNYATHKKLPKGFSKEFIESAFLRKK